MTNRWHKYHTKEQTILEAEMSLQLDHHLLGRLLWVVVLAI